MLACSCSHFSVLTKIIKSGYAALQLEYFFTAGPDEVRAWTVRVTTHTHNIRTFIIYTLYFMSQVRGAIRVLLTIKMIILAVMCDLTGWDNAV